MTKPRVFVCFPKGKIPSLHELFKDKFKIEYWSSNNITKEQLIEKVIGIFGIVCYSYTPIDQDVIRAAGNSLKIVSLLSKGYQSVDVNALKQHGIKIGYLGTVNTESTAETAVALLLSVSRCLKEFIKYNGYKVGQSERLFYGLQNSTVGIVGCGAIGTSVSRKLKTFDIKRLMYFARSEKPDVNAIGGEFCSLMEIMKESDFIVIALSLNQHTEKIISKELISLMKPNAILVNVARGDLIDQDALTEALQLGKIAGAGLDVTTPEPLPADHELFKLDNVVISPHIGGRSFECYEKANKIAVENILAVLEGREMPIELKI